MKQKLSSILYATGIGHQPAFIKDTACTIGAGFSNPEMAADCRPATASIALSPVKISYVVQGLALLLDPICPAYCGIGKVLYLEVGTNQAIVGENGKDTYLIRKTTADFRMTPQIIVASIMLYEIAFKPSETLKRLQACVKAFDKTGNVPAASAAQLCDAFYYEFAKSKQFVEVLDDLRSEEVEALARADVPKPIILSGTSISRPKMVKTEEKKRKPAIILPDVGDIVAKCQKGEYIVPYTWNAEAESYRQGLDTLDGFIPNQIFISLLEKIRLRTGNVLGRMHCLDMNIPADRVKALGKDYINVTLSGKPGTGKTRLAYALGAATGMPVYTISNSHNTDEDTYTGLTKMVDGHPMSVATDTVKCFENGGILLLEEINLPQAAVVMGALGQALEFPFILMKDGYQPIRRHPLCIIISTMNTGTAGSKAVSQPFANRFKQSFVLDDPTKEDFIRILGNTGAEGSVCRWVYECYERIVAGIENDNAMADVESILLSLSVRTCIGAIENIQEGMEAREAVKNSIIGKISEQDREVAKACAKIVDGMRNPAF